MTQCSSEMENLPSFCRVGLNPGEKNVVTMVDEERMSLKYRGTLRVG